MIDATILLNEGRCLGCHSNASESEMILMALLQRIAEAGGSGGGTPGGANTQAMTPGPSAGMRISGGTK